MFSFTIAPTFESYFIGVPTSGFLTSGLVTSAASTGDHANDPTPIAPNAITGRAFLKLPPDLATAFVKSINTP